MRKNLRLALIFILSSCTGKKSPDLIASVEAYLKTQLKDPSSFQVIKANVVDTLMMSKWLRDRYSEDTAMISQTISTNKVDLELQNFEVSEAQQKASYEKLLDKKVDVYRRSADLRLSDLNGLKQDQILYISVLVNYRAKNSFGALDIDTKTVYYSPVDSTFKIAE